MTTRPAKRRPPVFVVPLGLLVRLILGLSLAGLAVVLVASGTLARLSGGTTIADGTAVAAQQRVAERDLARGYEQATDQVRKARELKLAIPAQQADAIATKALADLHTLRHSALVSLAQLTGSTAEMAEAYGKQTEQAMDARRGQPAASSEPALLAPRIYAIVARFNDLATRLSDQATTELTRSPTPPPSARPTPTPSPTR